MKDRNENLKHQFYLSLISAKIDCKKLDLDLTLDNLCKCHHSDKIDLYSQFRKALTKSKVPVSGTDKAKLVNELVRIRKTFYPTVKTDLKTIIDTAWQNSKKKNWI